ncbi:MAG: hypothetical protein ACKVZ0_21145 [Gemmatimonadales bacterium]
MSSSGSGGYTPHACTSCHGGSYDPRSGLVLGATLLPLDPGLLQVTNRPAQEERFRQLNEMILRSGASPAAQAYINGMYGGRVAVQGAAAAANYVPSGWSTDANMYLGVVKKNCQMCHLATRPGLEFLTAGNVLTNKARVHSAVCETRPMPHAAVPFTRFWQEDTGQWYLPGLFAAWLGYPRCP